MRPRTHAAIFGQPLERTTTATLKKKIKALVDKTTSEKKLGKVYVILSKKTKAVQRVDARNSKALGT